MVLRPHQTKLRAAAPNYPDIRTGLFAEAQVSKGVVTMLDSDDLPNGALQVGKNIFVRFDRTMRRYGGNLLTPPKPDGFPILGLLTFITKTGSAFTFRFTRSSIYSRNAGAWDPLVGTLSGGNFDHIQAVNILDKFIFSNNGADPIQLIDPLGLTFGPLGNAPPYRYVTGFYNRAVGAALRGTSEVQVGWSADAIPTEWNSSVNETAGFSEILESPSDLSDPITGIFAFTNVMILMREYSLWLVTKQPIPTAPFYFYAAVPGIGCDSPDSIAVIPNGLAWLDTRTATVWMYTNGAAPVPIGRPIEATLIKGVDNPRKCFASYNQKDAEYTLCIPRTGSTLVTTWTYNFRTEAWAEGEYDKITSLDDIALSDIGGGLTIDELPGIIEDLVGAIDDLSPSTITQNARLFGRDDGQIMLERSFLDNDAGRVYTTEIVSKSFVIPENDTYISELRIEFIKRMGGSMQIWQSNNGGTDWTLYRNVADSYLAMSKPQIINIKKPLKARKYAWKITADNGLFEIINFSVRVSESGESVAPGR